MTRPVTDIADIIGAAARDRPQVVKGASAPVLQPVRGEGGDGGHGQEGDVPAQPRLRRVQVSLRADVHRTLKRLAVERDTTMSDMIRSELATVEPVKSGVVRSRAAAGYVTIQVLLRPEEHRRLKLVAIDRHAGLVDLIAGAVHRLTWTG